MKRREFVKSSFHLGLLAFASSFSALTLPERVFAQSLGQKPQFFILVYVNGGWDTSLAMAPWTQDQRPAESDYFLEYTKDQLLPFGSSFLGPAMAPLKSNFDRLTVVNGVFMSGVDGGHPSAALYAQSGNGQGNLGVLSAELEGNLLHSPFGILTNESIYTANKNKMTWDINGLMSERKVDFSDDILTFQDSNTELAQARNSMLKYGDKVTALNANLAKIQGNLTNEDVIAAALSSGLSSSVFYAVNSGNLDTHSSHEKNHLKDLTATMDRINSLLNTLQKTPGVGADGKPLQDSLLNQTTLMVVSEFTRTPALNGSQGKDHNPQSNSALLIGPGLKSGIVGESKLIPRAISQMGDSYLVGSALDIQTQNVVNRRENAFLIHPESVIATATRSMGFNPSQISSGIGASPVLKNILKG